MDAKPQRPRLRVHDENMPPPALPGAIPGKTLHQRTKSTPALSTLMQAGAIKAVQKKVLGEANANIRLAQPAKDDSEVGKSSPGKISIKDPVKSVVTATFARPATRPLASKAVSAQNVPVVVAPVATKPRSASTSLQTFTAEAEPAKKITAKKSLKILKEVQEAKVQQPEIESSKPASVAPIIQPIVAPKPVQPVTQSQMVPEKQIMSTVAVQRQEVRKTESVPLKDEPAPRPHAKAPGVTVTHLPPGFTSEQEYLNLIEYHTTQYQLEQHNLNGYPTINGQASCLPNLQPLPEQYYDIDEEQYEYGDDYTTARSFGLLPGESTGGLTTVLAPVVTDNVQEELALAREFVEATRPPEDIEDEQWDTSMVAEYGDEIFDYMRVLENRMAPNPRYMDQQTEIQWSMRAVLMDWVIQVHQRFSLLPETLFLTVNYIDRFLSCKVVSLGKLQLVGATAIFVAAKYEEVQCPTISEIIYMVDGGYSADELLKAERFMLSMLQFELGWPGPMSFLRRISKADDYDLETRTLAKYFLEVTIMDERFVGCTPSFLAAGAHCMARLMIHNDEWTKSHVFYSNYTWSQLRQLLLAILECCEEPSKHHSAVYDKYTDKRYKRASIFVAGKINDNFRVPHENPPPKPDSPRQSMNGLCGMMR